MSSGQSTRTPRSEYPKCPRCGGPVAGAMMTSQSVDLGFGTAPRMTYYHPDAISVYCVSEDCNWRDDFGELFVRERGDEREVWVRVVDVVRNDDGSEKVHYLAVHPDLCPLLSEDGDLGEPQEMTARNAVASTFGLRGEEYMPVGQS